MATGGVRQATRADRLIADVFTCLRLHTTLDAAGRRLAAVSPPAAGRLMPRSVDDAALEVRVPARLPPLRRLLVAAPVGHVVPDAELRQEEEREEGPSRSKMIAWIIISLLAIAVIVAGLLWARNQSQPGGGNGELIAAPKGDYKIKLRNLIKFLEDGDKTKITLRFRGREMAHQDIGMRMLERLKSDLEEFGQVEQFPKMEGRQMIMVIAPKKKK